MAKTVVVGMSGGVDSSVAAYLLKQQGYNVIGVTMHLFDILENNACCGIEGTRDAGRVADALGIPFYVMDFKEVFSENVISYFAEEYKRGRTPNPCIACNRYVKWEALLAKSRSIGADYLATGHYARVKHLPNGRWAICRSATAAKDQTYALYSLTQEQLAHTLMPVGEYEKEKIRDIAKELGLPVANKPDSQEICFVQDGDYAGYVERFFGQREETGNFVSVDGEVLGQHKGISHYTIGQRKGLGISFGRPMYVIRICPDTREVVLGEEKLLWTTTLTATDINCMGLSEFTKGDRIVSKIRYSHKGELCRIVEVTENSIKVEFERPVRAITPGQAAVFYKDDIVLGGGIIE